MLVVKVWCLPNSGENMLNGIHQEIVKAVAGIPELGVKSEADMLTLFPTDMMEYGLGTEILIEVLCDERPWDSQDGNEMRNKLARNIGTTVQTFFPKAKIYCIPVIINRMIGYWSSEEENVG